MVPLQTPIPRRTQVKLMSQQSRLGRQAISTCAKAVKLLAQGQGRSFVGTVKTHESQNIPVLSHSFRVVFSPPLCGIDSTPTTLSTCIHCRSQRVRVIPIEWPEQFIDWVSAGNVVVESNTVLEVFKSSSKTKSNDGRGLGVASTLNRFRR